MVDWFVNLTAGQGAFLGGASTAIGAIAAVFVAQALFGRRISDLKEGVAQAEKSVGILKESLEKKLHNVQESFDTTLAGLQEAIANTQAALYESSEDDEQPQPKNENAVYSPDERVREYWNEIRQRIESIASSPNVDGRTRAKYGRIDRRSYYDLIYAMCADGLIPNEDVAEEAIGLWYSCRRKDEIEEESAVRMEALWEEISNWPIP